MNTTPIIALGTPFGAWDQLVAPLAFGACQEKFVRWHDERSRDILALPKGADFALREFPADILAGLDGMLSPEGLLVWEARAVWTLDLLIQKLPTALFVAFVEAPEQMLVRNLCGNPEQDPLVLLAEWSIAAEQILKAVKRLEDRVLLLDAGECRSHPDDFLACLKQKSGLPDVSVSIPAGSDQQNALLHLVAESWTSADRRIASLKNELEIRCTGITSAEPNGVEIESSRKAVATQAWMELSSIREAASTTKKQCADLEGEKSRLLADKTSLAEKLIANAEMLLLELHSAHKESEHFFEQWKYAEGQISGRSLKVASVEIGSCEEGSEHKHVDFIFQEVALFNRSWPQLKMRLVEHRGNPGLLFFAPDLPSSPPLYGWKPNSTPEGVSYMLFVPGDAEPAAALVAATASDLLMVRESIALMRAFLLIQDAQVGIETDWRGVAERLIEQIDGLPERLHYDDVNGVSSEGAGLGVRFEISNIYFRQRVLRTLSVNWTVFPDGCKVEFMTHDLESGLLIDRAAPLNRRADRLFIVEFGKRFADSNLSQLFATLTGAEKALVVSIVSELPNFLHHFFEKHIETRLDRTLFEKMTGPLLREVQSIAATQGTH